MSNASNAFTKNVRTTYRPSTHPKWSRWARDNKHENPNPGLKMQISIEVFPAPTFDELCAMQGAMQAELRTGPINEDKLAFMDAINAEVDRCRPKPAKPVWMRRPNQNQSNEPAPPAPPPAPPTQHARIDCAQATELKGILKPETLRRRFISIPALMQKIQADIQAKVDVQAAIQTEIRAKAVKAAKAAQEAAVKAVKAAQEAAVKAAQEAAAKAAQEAPKTQAEMDAEAEAELLQARQM